MKRYLVFGLVAAFAVAASAAPNLDEGTQELMLDGLVNFDSAAGTEIVLNVGYGLFVADNVELAGIVGIADNDLYTLFLFGGLAELNIPIEDVPVVPFVNASIAYANADIEGGDSADAIVFGVAGGAKFFVTDDLAIAAQLNLAYATDDIYAEDDGDVSDTDITATLGLRYYFDNPGAAAN